MFDIVITEDTIVGIINVIQAIAPIIIVALFIKKYFILILLDSPYPTTLKLETTFFIKSIPIR